MAPAHLKEPPPPKRKRRRGELKARFGAILFILRGSWQRLRRWSREQTWTLPHLALFPAVMVYEEVLLRLFGSAGFFQSLIYPVLFGLAAGLVAACLTSLFRAKISRVISIILLFLIGLLFTVECLVEYSYQVYMTIGSIISGAGNVVGPSHPICSGPSSLACRRYSCSSFRRCFISSPGGGTSRPDDTAPPLWAYCWYWH